MIGAPASDRRYYPFYAKCVELGIPVSMHASANWTTTRPSDLGHPRHFDVVACDFPELVLILSHAGYPWVLEACLLAWKHPNVYLEIAAHRPRYFAAPGAGWEPLLRYGQTTIREKVLYGTGALKLNDKTGKPQQVGGVTYTIKDGIVYDAKQLLADVAAMVEKQKRSKQTSQP